MHWILLLFQNYHNQYSFQEGETLETDLVLKRLKSTLEKFYCLRRFCYFEDCHTVYPRKNNFCRQINLALETFMSATYWQSAQNRCFLVNLGWKKFKKLNRLVARFNRKIFLNFCWKSAVILNSSSVENQK